MTGSADDVMPLAVPSPGQTSKCLGWLWYNLFWTFNSLVYFSNRFQIIQVKIFSSVMRATVGGVPLLQSTVTSVVSLSEDQNALQALSLGIWTYSKALPLRFD